MDLNGAMTKEKKPTAVSETKQVGEAKPDWGWVEPTVWTERMLKALETGVKGGVWYSLMDKVYRERNLRGAFEKVKRNRGSAGVDHVTVERFEQQLEEELKRLQNSLKTGSYQPQGIRRHWIVKPGSHERRPLGIPTVRDRVVQTALRQVIEPIFEKRFAETSYGFRPGRSGKDALREVMQKLQEGHYWVVDADIRSYFDRIDHQKLMEKVREEVADGRVLELIEGFLKQEIFESLYHWKSEEGCPQGAVISPLLANIYLNPLDHRMQQEGIEMIRYADDFVILCSSREKAEQALKRAQQWIQGVGLELHPAKTRIVDMHEAGFDFLGYHFQAAKTGLPRIVKFPRRKSIKQLRANLKPLTKRANGHSLDRIIECLNPKLKGWFEYYKHSNRRTFLGMDRWVRSRLRGILRKRMGLKGAGRGADHQRWPNTYFHDRGLYSFTAAYDSAIQSSSREHHQLESPFRENRTAGSEGGATG